MKDYLGKEVQVNDMVALVRSGRSTLYYGEVTQIVGDRVKVKPRAWNNKEGFAKETFRTSEQIIGLGKE